MMALARAQQLLTSVMDDCAGTDEASKLYALLAPRPGLSSQQRVEIYSTSSRRAREKALEVIYPTCRQILGSRYFASLAAGYVTEHPSQIADLNVYGGGFPDYLETQCRNRPELGELGYLRDLALLEWDWHAVYYTPDDPDFDLARFSALAAEGRAEQVRFRLSASLRLIASDYPIREIWERHQTQGDTSAVAMGSREHLAIRRVAFRPQIQVIDAEIFCLAESLARGATLGEAANEGLAVEQLPTLVGAGWVVDLSVRDIV